MPDRDQGDHWDFLAADLGAKSSPKEETKQKDPESPELELDADVVEEPINESPTEEADETPVMEAPEASQEKPKKRQGGQKGDRVVSGFGPPSWLGRLGQPGARTRRRGHGRSPAPIPAADTPGESEPAPIFDLEPIEAEVVEAEVPNVEVVSDDVVEAIDESPLHDEPASEPAIGGFGAGILDDLAPDPANVQEERADTDEPQEERKGRRRRRRRKPRKQEADQDQPVETVIVDESKTEAKSPSEEEEEQEESPRRRGRGRRRGGRKPAPREEPITKSEDFGVGFIAADDDEPDDDEFEIFEDDETDAEEAESTGGQKHRGDRSKDQSQDKRPSKKVTHRGIPSWDEAVGHIVDSNLEGRSKKPESSGFRQRPPRRRGGDRSGNRGRS